MKLTCTLLVLILPATALAHSWYPYECCSDRDCYPVAIEQVTSTQGGWMLKDGTFIGHREARPSPDGRFHICRYEDGKGKMISIPGKPACFWAPIGAS